MKRIHIIHIMLFFFTAQLLFNLFLDIMQYRGDASPQKIAEVLQYFTHDDLTAGATYGRARIPVRFISVVLDGIILIFFMLSPARIVLENFCDRVSGNRRMYSAAIYIAILFTIYFFIMLPLSFYSDFIIEHRFGFSSMSFPFWCWTMLKLGLANLFFLEALFLTLTSVIQHFPRTWILMVPTAILIIRLISDLLFPYIMIPLFYKYHPLPLGSVRTKIEAYTIETGIPVSEIYVIEQSVYSRHTNAYFHGWGKFRKIYLYDTLVKTHTEDQLVTVIAHEIGHSIENHVIKDHAVSFLINILASIIMFLAYKKLKNEGDIPILHAYSPSTFPIYLVLFITVVFFAQMVTYPLSRHYEREADSYAIRATGNPDAFVDMQIKIAKENRSRLDPHPIVVFFRYRHPPTLERIKSALITIRHDNR